MPQQNRLKLKNTGTEPTKYRVTGSGEKQYAIARGKSDDAFTRSGFQNALKKASRKVDPESKDPESSE